MSDSLPAPEPAPAPAPASEAVLPVSQPTEYELLSMAKRDLLAAWIRLAVQPAKTPEIYTSYSMKHDFEDDTGWHVTNDEFKGAMLAAGHEPVDPRALNWCFRVRPRGRVKKERDWRPEGAGYGLYLASKDERQHLATLIERVQQEQRAAAELQQAQ